jgi:hypothetical protein
MSTLGRVFGLAAALVFVSACGGGGGGGSGGGTQPTSFTVSTHISSGSGTISPSVVTVARGQTTSIAVTAAAGFVIESVTGCGGSVNGSTYTTGPISSNCSVVVAFGLEGYRITQLSSPGITAFGPTLTDTGEAYWIEYDGTSMHILNRQPDGGVRNLWSYAIGLDGVLGGGLKPMRVNSAGDFAISLPSKAHPSSASSADAFVNGAVAMVGTEYGNLFLDQKTLTTRVIWAPPDQIHRSLDVFEIQAAITQRYTFQDFDNVNPLAINSKGQLLVRGESPGLGELFLFQDGESTKVASDSPLAADISDEWITYFAIPEGARVPVIVRQSLVSDSEVRLTLGDEDIPPPRLQIDSSGRTIFLGDYVTPFDPALPWAGGRRDYSLQQWDGNTKRELAKGIPYRISANDPGAFDMSGTGRVAYVGYSPECDHPTSASADPCGDWDVFVVDQSTAEVTRVTDLPANTIAFYVEANRRGEIILATQRGLNSYSGFDSDLAATWEVWLATPR